MENAGRRGREGSEWNKEKWGSLSLSLDPGRTTQRSIFESIEEKQGDGEDWKTLSLLLLLCFCTLKHWKALFFIASFPNRDEESTEF